MIEMIMTSPALENDYYGPIYIPPPSGSVDMSTADNGESWYSGIVTGFKDVGQWVIIVLILLVLFAGIWKLS